MLRDTTTVRPELDSEHVLATSKLGVELAPTLDRDTWLTLIGRVAQATRNAAAESDTLAAWLGDLLIYDEGRYRGQISEIARAAGMHPTTVRNAKLVCSRIPLSRRRDTLSWSHHCEVGKAFRDLDAICKWLEIAETEKLTRTQLRQRIRAARRISSAPAHAAEHAAPFALLRELRAVDRLLRRGSPAWQTWSPQACRRALEEVAALDGFLAELRTRAAKNGPARVT